MEERVTLDDLRRIAKQRGFTLSPLEELAFRALGQDMRFPLPGLVNAMNQEIRRRQIGPIDPRTISERDFHSILKRIIEPHKERLEERIPVRLRPFVKPVIDRAEERLVEEVARRAGEVAESSDSIARTATARATEELRKVEEHIPQPVMEVVGRVVGADLEQQIAKLRGALAPFARVGQFIIESEWLGETYEETFPVEEWRRAAAIYKETA